MADGALSERRSARRRSRAGPGRRGQWSGTGPKPDRAPCRGSAPGPPAAADDGRRLVRSRLGAPRRRRPRRTGFHAWRGSWPRRNSTARRSAVRGAAAFRLQLRVARNLQHRRNPGRCRIAAGRAPGLRKLAWRRSFRRSPSSPGNPRRASWRGFAARRRRSAGRVSGTDYEPFATRQLADALAARAPAPVRGRRRLRSPRGFAKCAARRP